MAHHKGFIHKLIDMLQSIFLNGLLILLPITLTISLMGYTIKLIQGWLQPIHRIEPYFLRNVPYSEFISALLVIFIVGFIFKSFFLRSFLHAIEETFFKLPLMKQLYFGIKQIVKAFTTQDHITFQRVVLVEFPRKGVYSIGFLTGETPFSLEPVNLRYVNVFIPTTPNPTTGFLIVVPESDVIDIDVTRQEAMSLIISAGIIQPDRLKRKQQERE